MQIDVVIQNINAQKGFRALDITRNEMASQHVRYMSGGRSLLFRLNGLLDSVYLRGPVHYESSLNYWKRAGPSLYFTTAITAQTMRES